MRPLNQYAPYEKTYLLKHLKIHGITVKPLLMYAEIIKFFILSPAGIIRGMKIYCSIQLQLPLHL